MGKGKRGGTGALGARGGRGEGWRLGPLWSASTPAGPSAWAPGSRGLSPMRHDGACGHVGPCACRRAQASLSLKWLQAGRGRGVSEGRRTWPGQPKGPHRTPPDAPGRGRPSSLYLSLGRFPWFRFGTGGCLVCRAAVPGSRRALGRPLPRGCFYETRKPGPGGAAPRGSPSSYPVSLASGRTLMRQGQGLVMQRIKTVRAPQRTCSQPELWGCGGARPTGGAHSLQLPRAQSSPGTLGTCRTCELPWPQTSALPSRETLCAGRELSGPQDSSSLPLRSGRPCLPASGPTSAGEASSLPGVQHAPGSVRCPRRKRPSH